MRSLLILSFVLGACATPPSSSGDAGSLVLDSGLVITQTSPNYFVIGPAVLRTQDAGSPDSGIQIESSKKVRKSLKAK